MGGVMTGDEEEAFFEHQEELAESMKPSKKFWELCDKYGPVCHEEKCPLRRKGKPIWSHSCEQVFMDKYCILKSDLDREYQKRIDYNLAKKIIKDFVNEPIGYGINSKDQVINILKALGITPRKGERNE